jgi:hypothetical protein
MADSLPEFTNESPAISAVLNQACGLLTSEQPNAPRSFESD